MSTGILYPDNDYDVYKETIDPNLGVDNLLDEEERRLRLKKKVIDPLHFSQTRKNEQDKSVNLRSMAYYRMLYVFLGMAIVVLSLVVFGTPFIPEFVVTYLIIVIIAWGVIWMILIYLDVNNRDKLDFEKIDYNKLMNVKIPAKTAADSTSLSSTAEVAMCIGQDCCPSGTFFVNNLCVPCPEGEQLSNGVCTAVANITETFTGKYLEKKAAVVAFYPIPTYVALM